MKSIQENCYKGTRILIGNDKRALVNNMVSYLIPLGFNEISIPVIQFQETFKGKVGEENNNLMFNFRDRGDRDICLAPEYTAIVQKLASKYFKLEKDVKLFYVQECFRGEKPQAGRYRQFTQFGIEILNPSKEHNLIQMASDLVGMVRTDYIVNTDAKRGLDYYKKGMGFEISCEELGSSRQICGGGEYEGGAGFAIGIDRILYL